jgi:antigen flippase
MNGDVSTEHMPCVRPTTDEIMSAVDLMNLNWPAISMPRLKVASTSGAFAQTLLAKLFLLFANLATGVIVARSLAPTGRGEQAAMTMWPGLLCGILSMGLGLALTYGIRRQPDRKSELLSTSILLALGFGALATTIGIVFVPHWLVRYDRSVIAFARLMLLIVPFMMATFVLQAAFEAHFDFTTSNLSKLLQQIVTVVILGLLAITHRLTPFTSTLGYLLPWAVVPVVLAWRLRDLITLRLPNFRVSAKELLSYGTRSSAIDLLGTLSGQVDQVLVVGLLSAGGLGLYSVALSVSRVLFVFHASLVTVLFPRAASLKPTEVFALMPRAARITSLMASVAAACLIVLLPYILVPLYGGAFKGVIPIARILCVEIVITGAASVLSQSFMATGKPGTVALLQVIGLLVTIPLLLILIPRFGLSGAALALLVSSTCRLAAVMACHPILLKTKLPNLIVTRGDIVFLLSKVKHAS